MGETPPTSPASLTPLFAEVAEPGSLSLSPGSLSLSAQQRSIVERSYSGPALVSGAPGTGKTTVAVHRAAFLAQAGKVLLVTFSKHLAVGLRDRLAQFGPQVAERADVINIDALATRVAAEAEPGVPRHWMDDSRALELWRLVLAEAGLSGDEDWTPEFLHEEWNQVVLGNAITSRFDYLRVRRAGRGRPLNRAARSVAWQLAEQYTRQLAEANLWTFRQLIAHAVDLAGSWADELRPRYRHVVADEAQDLSPAQLKLLRAVVPPGPDDLFLVGVPRPGIYGMEWVELTHRYRPAVVPELRGCASWQEELAVILRQVRDWGGDGEIGIAVPDSPMAAEVEAYLNANDVAAELLGADGPRSTGAVDAGVVPAGTVHVAVLHRFKGLEYRRMIVAGLREDAPLTRPLLDMATSRARESLVISWHGAPSPLLPGDPGRPES